MWRVRDYLVLEVKLLEQNRGFDAIGRVGGVEGDVGLCLLSHCEELFSQLGDARCH